MNTKNDRRSYAECGSTNDLARQWVLDKNDPAPDGAVVTTQYQTHGRGRRGSEWNSESGDSVLMTMVLHPRRPISEAWQLGFIAALAVAEALAGLGFDPKLKWPNDVLIDGRKVSGVLVETVTKDSGWAALVGIGVNINQPEFPYGESYVYPPSSLRILTGQAYNVEAVTDAIAAQLMRWEELHRNSGDFVPIAEAWRKRLAVGATVRGASVTATLEALNDDGSVRVKLMDGTFANWRTVDGEGSPNSV